MAGTSSGGYALCRLTTTGQPDGSFGTGGIVTTDVAGGYDCARAIAVQSDGAIVAAGHSHNGANNDVSLVRYTANGQLDTTFDSDGKLTVDVSSGWDFGYAVTLDPSGRIVVAGSSSNGSDQDITILRFLSSGALDTSFDTDGKLVIPSAAGDDEAFSVAIYSGKIAVGGYSYDGDHDFVVVRCDGAGTLDSDFGTGGVARAGGPHTDYARAMVAAADGKITLGGEINNGSNTDFAVARFTEDGSLDASFGTAGIGTADFDTTPDLGQSLAVQSDGKLLVGGVVYHGGSRYISVARFTAQGAVDTEFAGGIVKTSLQTHDNTDMRAPVAVQGDGKILLAGSVCPESDDYDFVVVRLNP